MDISRVKYNLNKKVRLKLPRYYLDGEYILSGCIIRKKENNEFFYQAELQDPCSHSVSYVRLDDISEISSPFFGELK